MSASHLVIFGDFLSDASGLAVVESHKDPCAVRELAVHSASAEMAMRPLANLCKVVCDKFPKREQLRPDLVEIVDRLKEASELLAEAVALDNPDRRKFYEKGRP